MVTVTRTLNNGQGSRWTQADGKQYNKANTIGQLAWHLSLSTESLTAVMLQVAVSIWAGSGNILLAVFFFFTICIITIEGIKASEGRIKTELCRCSQGKLRAQIV